MSDLGPEEVELQILAVFDVDIDSAAGDIAELDTQLAEVREKLKADPTNSDLLFDQERIQARLIQRGERLNRLEAERTNTINQLREAYQAQAQTAEQGTESAVAAFGRLDDRVGKVVGGITRLGQGAGFLLALNVAAQAVEGTFARVEERVQQLAQSRAEGLQQVAGGIPIEERLAELSEARNESLARAQIETSDWVVALAESVPVLNQVTEAVEQIAASLSPEIGFIDALNAARASGSGLDASPLGFNPEQIEAESTRRIAAIEAETGVALQQLLSLEEAQDGILENIREASEEEGFFARVVGSSIPELQADVAGLLSELGRGGAIIGENTVLTDAQVDAYARLGREYKEAQEAAAAFREDQAVLFDLLGDGNQIEATVEARLQSQEQRLALLQQVQTLIAGGGDISEILSPGRVEEAANLGITLDQLIASAQAGAEQAAGAQQSWADFFAELEGGTDVVGSFFDELRERSQGEVAAPDIVGGLQTELRAAETLVQEALADGLLSGDEIERIKIQVDTPGLREELATAGLTFDEFFVNLEASANASANALADQFVTVFQEKRSLIEQQLSVDLNIDTENGINDTQDAINEIEAKLTEFNRRREAAAEAASQGLDEVARRIESGELDELIDDVLEGEGGTDRELLLDLELKFDELAETETAAVEDAAAATKAAFAEALANDGETGNPFLSLVENIEITPEDLLAFAAQFSSSAQEVLGSPDTAAAFGAGISNAVEEAATIAGGTALSAAEGIGLNVAAGLATGIESGAGGISSAIDGIVADALARLEAGFEVESPARTTFRIGEFIDEGLAEGLQSGASTEAMRKLADDLLSQAEELKIDYSGVFNIEDDDNASNDFTQVLGNIQQRRAELADQRNLLEQRARAIDSINRFGNFERLSESIGSGNADGLLNRFINAPNGSAFAQLEQELSVGFEDAGATAGRAAARAFAEELSNPGFGNLYQGAGTTNVFNGIDPLVAFQLLADRTGS